MNQVRPTCSKSPITLTREAFRIRGARNVWLAHNHPSGHPEPSRADETITSRLKDALALVDVRALDHVVVGGMDTVSFAERGLL